MKINPRDAIPYFYRGDARAALEDYDGAVADYSQYIKMELNCADAYFNRGTFVAKRETSGEPLQITIESLRLTLNVLMHMPKEVIFVEKKEAIADFQKAISFFYKGSMLDEVRILQKEIQVVQDEIKNTPWWQMRVYFSIAEPAR